MNVMKLIKKKKILVIGDVMLDTYCFGSVTRISPEAPVPVLKKRETKSLPGGAANVAANLIAAGQDVSVMSVIGSDGTGSQLCGIFQREGIKDDLLIQDPSRPTTAKIRFMGQNHQQILRYDVEETADVNDEMVDRLLAAFSSRLDSFDLIVMSDYLKGMLTERFTRAVIGICRQRDKKVIIDVKDPRINKYDGAFLLKPNLKEIKDLTKMPAGTDREIVEASLSLCQKCHTEYVLTTCGAHGMILVDKTGNSRKLKCASREVYDVTGAGDTVIAYLTAGIANHLGMLDSLKIANIAAGLQVAKVGTSSVSLSEVDDSLRRDSCPCTNGGKIVSRDDLRLLRSSRPEEKIVFTNGCFDILHIGHVRYLKSASELGDILVVGVNSDESVRRLKGPKRPINSERERMEVLASLEFVDYVVKFEEDTPYRLIQAVQPDVLVKGADYRPEQVVGKDLVEARGGSLKLIPLVEGKSTSKILGRLEEQAE